MNSSFYQTSGKIIDERNGVVLIELSSGASTSVLFADLYGQLCLFVNIFPTSDAARHNFDELAQTPHLARALLRAGNYSEVGKMPPANSYATYRFSVNDNLDCERVAALIDGAPIIVSDRLIQVMPVPVE